MALFRDGSACSRRHGRLGLVCLGVAGFLVALSRPASAQMATGTYVGNGAAGLAITGLGFTPDVVLVKGNDFDASFTATSAVMRTSTMAGDSSKPMVLDNALTTNQIQSLDANGFTVGDDRRVNKAGTNFYWVAFKSDAYMKVGTYVGNGGSNSITGLGFSPDYLIVMSSAAWRAVHACSVVPSSPSFRSYEFDTAAWIANQITSLDPGGFSVTHNGAAPYTNEIGVVYHYVAWKAAPQRTVVGSYPGNGTDGRNFTGVGFQPGWLITKAIYDNDPPFNPSLTPPPAFRMASMGAGDITVNFSNGNFAPDYIQAFQPDGFQIGGGLGINRPYVDCNVDGPGCEYFYVAFNTVAPDSPPLTTTQGAGTLTVTAPNSFEMIFTTNASGAVEYFYDLAEDPGRAVDLVGGTTDKQAMFFDGIETGFLQNYSSYGPNTGTMHLLEATPTRVRVRQDAFYRRLSSTTILAGVRGFGDYSVYPSGRLALRWDRRTTSGVTYQSSDLNLCLHRSTPAALDNWSASGELGNTFPTAVGTDDFILAKIDVPTARTDFLQILDRDWSTAGGHATTADQLRWGPSGAGESAFLQWREDTDLTIPANTNEIWNFLTYFKPTNLGNVASPWLDPAVTSRRDDYRTPSPLTISVGGGWNENTADADFFNESEAVYTFDMDPGTGLTFGMDGSITTRYRPFFKIRQWRLLEPPATMTVEGVTQTRDVDYRADVKPVARAHYAHDVRWYSTMQSAAAVTSPDIGAPGAVGGGPVFGLGRFGRGVNVSASGEYVAFPTADGFVAERGAVEFWFQPTFASDLNDGLVHDIAGFVTDANNWFVLERRADRNLYFDIRASGSSSTLTVTSANYSWRAKDWVHVRLTWDSAAPLAAQQRLFLNGQEPVHIDPTADYSDAALSLASEFRFGNTDGEAAFAAGIYDEIYAYETDDQSTQALAHGGLVSDAREYLADPTRNATLPFNGGGDGLGRASYLYLGSDSRPRGFNVTLATAGAGVSLGALEWEYWDGTGWTSLETAGGFTDGTRDLTKDGILYWTSDPANWSVYSINGGPELYYLRAHLAPGEVYGVAPVEKLLKTDILLFQYFGDVTAAAQTFQFTGPATADLEIDKDDFQAAAVPGTEVTYTITVTNHGPDTVTSVRVTDPVPPEVQGPWTPNTPNGSYDVATGVWTFATALGDEQSAILTLRAWIDPAAGTGTLRNTATVSPPSGWSDPNPSNDFDRDDDNLTPQADLTLSKSAAPNPADLGGPLTYTLVVVNAGPSRATNVTLTDALPPDMTLEAATPAGLCSFDTPTRTLTCTLGDIAPSASATVVLLVRPWAVGNFRNTAWVTSTEDPGPDSATQDTTVAIPATGLPFFTVTSTSGENVVEFLNPAAGSCDTNTAVRWKLGGYPTGPGDSVASDLTTCVADPDDTRKCSCTHSGLTNGTTYYYAAFAQGGAGPGRFNTGRPPDPANEPGVKWAFSAGAFGVAAPTVTPHGVIATANDGVVYSMQRGAADSTPANPTGGRWPTGATSSEDWRPVQLGGVVQSRSPFVPAGAVVEDSIYLGAQDGRVYAVNAKTGALRSGWTSPKLGDMVQAAPAGIFSAYGGGGLDYILVGTRDDDADNVFSALKPGDGTVVLPSFDNTTLGGLGIISGMAAVDYETKRVFFASRRSRRGGSTDTLWCLQIASENPGPALSRLWSRDLDDIDGSPVVRNRRVYLGSARDGGTVFSLDMNCGDDRTYPHGDGQVKGFIFPDRNSQDGDVYFATNSLVWGLSEDSDADGILELKFQISLGGTVKPSSPVLLVPGTSYLYVGGTDGRLYEIDVASGTVINSTRLGDGLATVGAPSLDRGYEPNLIHVGTVAGIFYAVKVPLP